MQAETIYDIGIFCATPYDGIFLLGEKLAHCGDRGMGCIRYSYYATQDWVSSYYGTISFDTKGDAAGSFRIDQIEADNWRLRVGGVQP